MNHYVRSEELAKKSAAAASAFEESQHRLSEASAQRESDKAWAEHERLRPLREAAARSEEKLQAERAAEEARSVEALAAIRAANEGDLKGQALARWKAAGGAAEAFAEEWPTIHRRMLVDQAAGVAGAPTDEARGLARNTVLRSFN